MPAYLSAELHRPICELLLQDIYLFYISMAKVNIKNVNN